MITGYLKIKNDADFSDNKPYALYNLQGRIFPVYENGGHEGTLIRIPEANNLYARMVDKNIECQFACEVKDGFIYPPGLNEFEKTQYCARLNHLPQPYENYKQFIISDSLKAGKFTDTCLFNEIDIKNT